MLLITIKNSGSLYFPTGDIVLLSLPKDDVVTAFKVDRVFLIRSSPVFEGMFALPPSGDVESYDNVPLVKLQDEPDDLTMFLKALYDSRCIPWQKHDFNTIKMVEGTLLLATKYQIDHLRERIISLLQRDWPSELHYWDINEAEIKVNKNKKSEEFTWPILTPDPCEAIRLARRCDVPSILPAAFYRLSRTQGMSDRRIPYSLQELVFGGGTPLQQTADFSILSSQDFYCLAVGQNAILRFFDGLLDDAVSDAIQHKPLSPDPTKCEIGLQNVTDQFRQEVFQDFGDPLSVMKEDDYSLDCRRCRNEFQELLKTKREIIWNNLPSLFMLDTKQ